MKILCRIFGHKWRWYEHGPFNQLHSWWVFEECSRCNLYSGREKPLISKDSPKHLADIPPENTFTKSTNNTDKAIEIAERAIAVSNKLEKMMLSSIEKIAQLERQRNDLHQTTNRYQERYRRAENALRGILNSSDSEMRDGDFARDKAAEVLHVTSYP